MTGEDGGDETSGRGDRNGPEHVDENDEAGSGNGNEHGHNGTGSSRNGTGERIVELTSTSAFTPDSSSRSRVAISSLKAREHSNR